MQLSVEGQKGTDTPKMSQLLSFLSNSSIFKNYLGEKGDPCVAIKGDSQIFTARLNVVKTAPVYHQKNYFKLADITSSPPFRVSLLVLNHNETLLAVVGDSNIAIVDVKDPVDFDSPAPTWSCFDVSISLPESPKNPQKLVVKAVLWHPASSKHSELVILTNNEILLYDIVYSLYEPMLSLPLMQFSQLKDKAVLSIVFGSSVNFADSLSLYLSTDCGQIYAIFPFTYKTSTISTTKAQLAAFVDDWRSCTHSYDARVPPAAAFASYRTIFAKHSALVDAVEAKLRSPLFAEAEEPRALSFDMGEQAAAALELLGPLASTGPESRLVQVGGHSGVLVLAAVYKDRMGNIVITHLAQIIPLTVAIEMPREFPAEPIKPVRKPKQPKDVRYMKPPRGFGYIVDSDEDSDDSQNDDFEAKMHKYYEEVGFSNVKRKIHAFVDANFNKMAVLSTDSTDFKYTTSTPRLFQSLRQCKFLVALGQNVVLGDLARAVSGILDPYCLVFDVSYKLLKCDSEAANFAYIEDTIEGTGEYLIGNSSLGNAGVFHVEKTENQTRKAPSRTQPFLLKFRDNSRTHHSTLPAEELRLIKTGSGAPLPSGKGINPTQFEALNLAHQITSDLARKVGALTKFLLALQAKIEIQFEDLTLQAKDLLAVQEKTKQKEKYTKNHERIEKLISRQEQLIAREETLRCSLVERFEKARADQKLPLSGAEREWFKELNSITKTVAVCDASTPSLCARLDTLKIKVSELKDKRESLVAEDYLNSMLSGLLLGTNLSRVALNLSLGGELLLHSRRTVDHCLERLQGTLHT